MGIKNTKGFWPPNFPAEDKTITLKVGSTEQIAFKGHTWVKYNGRTIAIMPSHVGSDPVTKGVRNVNMRVGYASKTYAPIEINVGESFTLYDVKFHLTEAQSTNELSYKYNVSKATKSGPAELKFNTATQLNFDTVLKHTHNGSDYYLTLGSIGEKHVDFFIWNSSFEVIESVSFGDNNKWCKRGDFIFNLQGSTQDAATIVVKKQTTRDVALGEVTLSFDEIIRLKDNAKSVTMQIVNFVPPRLFDLWCTLDVAGQDQITGYLSRMVEKDLEEFAIAYSIEYKSVQMPVNDAPKFNLKIKVIDSPKVNFNEEFTLMKGQSVTLNGADLKIRFDGSSHKHKTDGRAVGFFHLTTTIRGKEKENRFSVKDNGTASFDIDSYNGKLIKTSYDASVTLQIQNEEECKESKEY